MRRFADGQGEHIELQRQSVQQFREATCSCDPALDLALSLSFNRALTLTLALNAIHTAPQPRPKAIGFPVPDVVPVPVKFGSRLRELASEHEAFMGNAEDRARVSAVLANVEEASSCEQA